MQYHDVVRDFLKLIHVRPDKPDLSWLTRIAREFHRMPYENLTKIIRLQEVTDPDERPRMPDVVLCDHTDMGAGGTCFSLTYFFQGILEDVGYDVYPVMCDRSYGSDTHCAVIVLLGEEKYLVDPGYLMEAPIVIPPKGFSIQVGGIFSVRLQRLGVTNQYLLITHRNGKSKIRYRMKDVPISREDFFEKWKDSFEWAMMRRLCVSKQTADGQLFMRDGTMRKDTKDGKSQGKLKIDIATSVERSFGIKGRLIMDAHDIVSKLRGDYKKGGNGK